MGVCAFFVGVCVRSDEAVYVLEGEGVVSKCVITIIIIMCVEC